MRIKMGRTSQKKCIWTMQNLRSDALELNSIFPNTPACSGHGHRLRGCPGTQDTHRKISEATEHPLKDFMGYWAAPEFPEHPLKDFRDNWKLLEFPGHPLEDFRDYWTPLELLGHPLKDFRDYWKPLEFLLRLF